jgi:hypothetical protein
MHCWAAAATAFKNILRKLNKLLYTMLYYGENCFYIIILAWFSQKAARSAEETKTSLHNRFSAIFPGNASCYYIKAFLMLASDDP